MWEARQGFATELESLIVVCSVMIIIIIIKLFAIVAEGNDSGIVNREKPFWKELGVERDLVRLEVTLDPNSEMQWMQEGVLRCPQCYLVPP